MTSTVGFRISFARLQRRERVPGGEPAEDDVAAAELADQLAEPRHGAVLEVLLDLEALGERLPVDPGERVAAAVDEEDPRHGIGTVLADRS